MTPASSSCITADPMLQTRGLEILKRMVDMPKGSARHKARARGEDCSVTSRYVALALSVSAALLLVCAALQPRAAGAAGPEALHQAILVVEFGDGKHLVRCVHFSEKSISGLDLLRSSGLEVITRGGAVCRIETEGCDYPAVKCFCECAGTPCAYWSYWHWGKDRWIYAQEGSADYALSDGDIEGWVWGDGQLPPMAIHDGEACPPLPETAPNNGTRRRQAVPAASLDIYAASPTASHKRGSEVPPDSGGTQGAPHQAYAAFIIMAMLLAAGWLLLAKRSRE